MPAAPGRFSITIGWPSASPSAGATVRAVMSTLPPGTKGTISRIGLLGKPCAPAAHATSASRAPASLTRLPAVIFLLLVFLGRRLLAVGFLLLVGLLLRRRFFRRGLLLVLFRVGLLRLGLLRLGLLRLGRLRDGQRALLAALARRAAGAARDDVIAAAFLVGMAHGARGSDPKVEAASLAVAEVQPRVAAAGVEACAADRDRNLDLGRLGARGLRLIGLDDHLVDLGRGQRR